MVDAAKVAIPKVKQQLSIRLFWNRLHSMNVTHTHKHTHTSSCDTDVQVLLFNNTSYFNMPLLCTVQISRTLYSSDYQEYCTSQSGKSASYCVLFTVQQAVPGFVTLDTTVAEYVSRP